MKNIVRALVVAFTLTGAVASSYAHSASSAVKIGSRASALPVPMCPPDDPNACGIGH